MKNITGKFWKSRMWHAVTEFLVSAAAGAFLLTYILQKLNIYYLLDVVKELGVLISIGLSAWTLINKIFLNKRKEDKEK